MSCGDEGKRECGEDDAPRQHSRDEHPPGDHTDSDEDDEYEGPGKGWIARKKEETGRREAGHGYADEERLGA